MVNIGNWVINFHIGNFNNPEKAILPTLVYVSSPPDEYKDLDGFAFALGWWSWGIQLTFGRLKKENLIGGND